MCAIIGTKDFTTLLGMIDLNSYRGSHSHSISFYNIETGNLELLKRDFGMPDLYGWIIPENTYCVAHIQAPTTNEKTIESIHPAVGGNTKNFIPDHALWHNGILKEDTIKEFSSKYKTTWDTKQILNIIIDEWNDIKSFDHLDGTFSCVYYRKETGCLYTFRNEISPLFIDDNMNISSTKFEGSRETEPNQIWQLNLKDNTMTSIGTFTTVENPYFFGD